MMKKSKVLGIIGVGALGLLPFSVSAGETPSGGIICPNYVFKDEDIVCEISLPSLESEANVYYSGFSANYSLDTGILYNSFEVKNYTMDININSANGFALGKTSGFDTYLKLAEVKFKFDENAVVGNDYKITLTNVDITDLAYNSFLDENNIELENLSATVTLSHLDLAEELMNHITESEDGTKVIYNLNQNFDPTVEIINKIQTNGAMSFRDASGTELGANPQLGTGSMLVVEFGERKIEYDLSIKGDVTGNGKVKMADVMKVATHIVEGNVIEGAAFEKAADVTGDGDIKMNDAMKMATFIVDGGEL